MKPNPTHPGNAVKIKPGAVKAGYPGHGLNPPTKPQGC